MGEVDPVRKSRNASRILVGGGATLAAAALIVFGGIAVSAPPREPAASSFTVRLAEPAPPMKITEARVPGRPIVLIDAGHGGADPGATGVSGDIVEKQLTLQLALELRERLAKNGRVRVAL